jgi:hypothetical protein
MLTLIRPSIEVVSELPPMDANTRFDTVTTYLSRVLFEYDAGDDIVGPQIDILGRKWFANNQEDAHANRRVIMQGVAAIPDLLANREAYRKVTGVDADPVALITGSTMSDVFKPPRLSRESQLSSGAWQLLQRVAIMEHVRLYKQGVEQSDLPDTRNGLPFKQRVADFGGEHHGRQSGESLQYGCGVKLDLDTRPLRDIMAPADYLGAKFDRENSGNCDEFGRPLSDVDRSRQYAAHLIYFYDGPDGYWFSSERNNAGEMARAMYEGGRRNRPNRLMPADQAFPTDISFIYALRKPYIDVTNLDFSDIPALTKQLIEQGLVTA